MRNRSAAWVGGIALLGALAGAARADDIPIFSTGVDAHGRVLSPGSGDPHYQLIAVPLGLFLPLPGSATLEVRGRRFVPNDPVGSPGSAWIGPGTVADAPWPPGIYVYRTTFDLEGLDPATAQIVGTVAVDNVLFEVLLNGVPQGIRRPGFMAFSSSFTISQGFNEGVNTLEFIVANLGRTGNPTGFRAVMGGAAEPLTTEIDVDVDIKPGSDSNKINLKSKGKVPVAVFGTPDFDAATIDPSTVTLAGAPVCTKGKDKSKGKKGKRKKKHKKGKHGDDDDGDHVHDRLMASLEDVNDDGLLDLVLHFRTRELQLDPSDTFAVLVGETLDGIPIVGQDSVRIKSKR